MSEYRAPEKQGITRGITPNEAVWFKGLLRYCLNGILNTKDPDGETNPAPMVNLSTFGQRRDESRLRFLMISTTSSNHAVAFERQRQPTLSGSGEPRPNATITLGNLNSREQTLVLRGWGRRIHREEELRQAEATYAKLWDRIYKGHAVEGVRKSLDRRPEGFAPLGMYEVEIWHAHTQGQRLDESGLPVDEGRPVVPLEALEDFEDLPPGPGPLWIPPTHAELFGHLGLLHMLDGDSAPLPPYVQPPHNQ